MSGTRHAICSRLIIKTSERCQLLVVFDFEHIKIMEI